MSSFKIQAFFLPYGLQGLLLQYELVCSRPFQIHIYSIYSYHIYHILMLPLIGPHSATPSLKLNPHPDRILQ